MLHGSNSIRSPKEQLKGCHKYDEDWDATAQVVLQQQLLEISHILILLSHLSLELFSGQQFNVCLLYTSYRAWCNIALKYFVIRDVWNE